MSQLTQLLHELGLLGSPQPQAGLLAPQPQPMGAQPLPQPMPPQPAPPPPHHGGIIGSILSYPLNIIRDQSDAWAQRPVIRHQQMDAAARADAAAAREEELIRSLGLSPREEAEFRANHTAWGETGAEWRRPHVMHPDQVIVSEGPDNTMQELAPRTDNRRFTAGGVVRDSQGHILGPPAPAHAAFGWTSSPDGSSQAPVPGGPADPAYRAAVATATRAPPRPPAAGRGRAHTSGSGPWSRNWN